MVRANAQPATGHVHQIEDAAVRYALQQGPDAAYELARTRAHSYLDMAREVQRIAEERQAHFDRLTPARKALALACDHLVALAEDTHTALDTVALDAAIDEYKAAEARS